MYKHIISTLLVFLLAGCGQQPYIPVSDVLSSSSMMPAAVSIPQIQEQPETMRHFYLENGLEVLTIENNSSPMVCLNMTIRSGAAYEDYSTSGMTHMLEHLLFNGTERRTQEELYEETDFYGIYSNAFTRKYFTNFFMLLPAEFAAQGMDIQSDMIFHSSLPEEKLEKERGIVLEEIGKDMDSEGYAVQNFFNRATFGSTGVGLPTLGTSSTIQHMSRDDIYRFYRTHYVPNNMILTVIGHLDENLEDQLEQYYGSVAPHPHESNFDIRPAKPASSQVVNQTVLPVSNISGQLVYPLPRGGWHPENSHPGRVSMPKGDVRFGYEMYASLINDHLSAQVPDYSPSVSVLNYPGNERLVIDFSASPDEDVNVVLNQLTSVIANISVNIHDIITDRAVASWVKQKEVELVSLLDSPHYYSMMQSQDLAIGGQYVIAKLTGMGSITADQLIRNFQHILTVPLKVNIVLPETAGSAESVIVEEQHHKAILPSGATLITSTSGGSRMFGMHILIKNRSVIEADLGGGAEVLHTLLESGTDMYSSEEIKNMLGDLGAQTKFVDMSFIPYDDYYNSPEWGYIRFECLEEDAEIGIRLITHLMGNTVLTEASVAEGLRDAQMRLGMQRGSARDTASKEFRKLFFGSDHPSTKAVSGTAESLARMNLETLTALQQRYFRPENYVVSISSSLPQDQLEQIFNSIWTDTGTPAARMAYDEPISGSENKKVIDLGKDQAQIRIGYRFEMDPADGPALSLMTDILSYRMMFDLRETQGLAYTLGMSSGQRENVGWIISSIGTGTENIDLALTGMTSYYNPARLYDLTQEEIDKTVNSNKGRYMMRNLTRIGQAFYMGYYEFLTGDYENAIRRNYLSDDLSVEDIQAVADKYLNLPDDYVQLIVK